MPKGGEKMGDRKKLSDIQITDDGIKELRESCEKPKADFLKVCSKHGLTLEDGIRRVLFDYDGR